MTKNGAVGVARDCGRHVKRAVAPRPSKDRLNLEALALAILVVRRDPLGRLRLDIVDAQHIADRMTPPIASPAGVATFRLVGCARRRIRRKHRALPSRVGHLLGCAARRKLGLVDPIGAALVIDQAARSEFGDGEEARALEIGRLWRSAAAGRHIGIER